MEGTKKKAAIAIQPLTKLSKQITKDIAEEGARVAKFMELEALVHDVRWLTK